MVKFAQCAAIAAVFTFGCSGKNMNGPQDEASAKKYEGAPIACPSSPRTLVSCGSEQFTDIWAESLGRWQNVLVCQVGSLTRQADIWGLTPECSVSENPAEFKLSTEIVNGKIVSENMNLLSDTCRVQAAMRVVAMWIVGMENSDDFELPGRETEIAVMHRSILDDGTCQLEITQYDADWFNEAAKKYEWAP